MGCKKLIELHLKKICLYSTYSSFLVINVCNQGKPLSSPCMSRHVVIIVYIQLEQPSVECTINLSTTILPLVILFYDSQCFICTRI